MFQEPRLLPWATVLANVAVGLGPAPGPDGAERARAALARVGLAKPADEWPAGLSGGQKSRVALARALVSRPRLLMLDEPLGALDALTRIEMQDLLQATRRQDGFTAVLVTHDVSEAVALADRIVAIEEGALTMDVAVRLPPQDRRGSVEAAAVAQAVLERLLGHEDGGAASRHGFRRELNPIPGRGHAFPPIGSPVRSEHPGRGRAATKKACTDISVQAFVICSPIHPPKLCMVPWRGLEPPRCYPLVPETSASTNSATRALTGLLWTPVAAVNRIKPHGTGFSGRGRRRPRAPSRCRWRRRRAPPRAAAGPGGR